MTVKGGTSPACAACKYQRRICHTSKCPLAPYFPASETHVFQNAHKLFGVSKILKLLEKMKTKEERDETMKSIIFESNLRQRFPVDGCVGYINLLQQQLAQYTQELQYVYAKLAISRDECGDPMTDHRYSPELQLGMTPGNNAGPLAMLPQHANNVMMMPYEVSNYSMNENNKCLYVDNDSIKQMWVQDLDYDNDLHNDQIAIQMQMDNTQAFQTQQETKVDYSDIPFDSISIADDRQSYIVSREGCGSRSPPVESPIRSVLNHVPPVAPRNALPVKGSGAGRLVRQALSVLRRERKEKTVKRAALGFRVCGLVFCMVSLAVMATDKNRGWALDSFYWYKEFRYCISVNVAGFLYSVVQTCDLAFTMCTGKHVLRHKYRFHFDFAMDQILTYLLMSASLSAATRVDDWQSNWGKDEFPMIASISVGLSFMSFASLAASTLVSGYALCTWSSF